MEKFLKIKKGSSLEDVKFTFRTQKAIAIPAAHLFPMPGMLPINNASICEQN